MGATSQISAKLLLSLVCSLVALVHAGDQQDYFINPPDSGSARVYTSDITYILGTTQNITWSTVYSSYSITLWQENSYQGGAQKGVSIFGRTCRTTFTRIQTDF